MIDDNDSNKQFTRRAIVIGALQGGLITLLAGRLAWLQIVHGQKYKTLSDKNSINIKVLAPSRGLIVDRNDIPLAENNQNFRVLVVPEQTDNLDLSIERLSNLINLTPREKSLVTAKVKKSASFLPVEVRDNLTWDDVAKIEVNLPDLPGLSIDVGQIRHYPLGEASSHIIGYVGAVEKSDLTGDPVLTLPGFKIGKTGIEKYYDENLKGKAGASQVEVNVRGRQVRELSRDPSQTGDTIKLTLDSRLQTYVQERLSVQKSASAVVMDAHTGAVYALASSPSFDPNQLTKGISAEDWEELLSNPGLPLNNKALSGQYPPGSTFKMITAIAGLEEGVITRNTSENCKGYYDYGDTRFHCWKRGGHGRVDIVDALSESCDTYFYKIAKDIGIDTIARYAHMFGLGDKTGFELDEERAGLMPTKDWKIGHTGQRWHPGETLVASIGQGYILSTPLQLATMTARLANGGYAVKPWITASLGERLFPPSKPKKIKISKRNLDLVLKGMKNATSDPQGTAIGSQIPEKNLRMGGKTGTSQVRRITMEEREQGINNKDLPWHLRHHALFVGYAPLNNPRYVCSVIVEHGGSGSSAAAPIARDILYQIQKQDPASTPIFQKNNALSRAVVPPKKPDIPPQFVERQDTES